MSGASATTGDKSRSKSMWCSKKLISYGALIMAMHTVVGMDTFIPIDFSPPALQPVALQDTIAKKKACRRQRLEKYKKNLPHIKTVLEKCATAHTALEAFMSQISGYDTCQISGVSQLGLDTFLADCIAEIDKHIPTEKTALAESNGIPMAKKLLLLRVINERRTLQLGLEYMRRLIQVGESTVSTSDSDDELLDSL
jgi:hypothetical protein